MVNQANRVSARLTPAIEHKERPARPEREREIKTPVQIKIEKARKTANAQTRLRDICHLIDTEPNGHVSTELYAAQTKISDALRAETDKRLGDLALEIQTSEISAREVAARLVYGCRA